MPNMFGSGPLKKTLNLLANEVWGEHCLLLASSWKRSRKWVEKEPLSSERATVSIRSLLVPSQRLSQEGAYCLKLMGPIQGPTAYHTQVSLRAGSHSSLRLLNNCSK